MVNIKEEGGELVFAVDVASGISPTGNIVRVSADAARVIEEIRAETGLSTQAVASALITYAGKHYSVEKV